MFTIKIVMKGYKDEEWIRLYQSHEVEVLTTNGRRVVRWVPWVVDDDGVLMPDKSAALMAEPITNAEPDPDPEGEAYYVARLAYIENSESGQTTQIVKPL